MSRPRPSEIVSGSTADLNFRGSPDVVGSYLRFYALAQRRSGSRMIGGTIKLFLRLRVLH